MLIVITGGSGSGKSKFAEDILGALVPEEKVYLATMEDIDGEMKSRIRNHRDMRRDKNFRTIEQGTSLETLSLKGEKGVLLECMSNLLANEMYKKGGVVRNDVAMHILNGVAVLKEQTEHVVIVTNEMCSDVPPGSEMKQYLKEAGVMNQSLVKESDIFVEVVYGIPLVHKGKELYENIKQSMHCL